jgi:hypothetical protein
MHYKTTFSADTSFSISTSVDGEAECRSRN